MSVICRFRHSAAVEQPHSQEQSGEPIEYQSPREFYLIAEHHLQHSGERHENAVDEDYCESVERVSEPHVFCLVVVVEFYHVEPVGSHVVGGAAEGDDEEQAHGGLKPECRRYAERYASQCAADEHLHGEHPPALGLQEVDERAPQRFYHPRQSQPSGEETHLSIGESHLHIHHHGETRHDGVWQSLGEI